MPEWLPKRPKNKAIVLSLIASLCLFIIALLLFIRTYDHSYRLSINSYGETIGKLAQRQLALPLQEGNLISLQSQLNSLLEYERVISVVIYDIDNNNIVQAGINIIDQDRGFEIFHTPITLDSNLLGSLKLSLDTGNDQNPLLLIASLFILGFSVVSFSVISLAFIKHLDTNQLTEAVKAETVVDKQQKNKQSIASVKTHRTLLILHINNTHKLYQQLNRDVKQDQIQRLHDGIKQACILYSGQQVSLSPDTITLDFSDLDETCSRFNAICCAYLLQKACRRDKWLLSFSCIVTDEHWAFSDAEAFFHIKQLCSVSASKLTTLARIELLRNDKLQERINIDTQSSTEGYIFIQSLSENYQNLIDNQLSQLASTTY
ncbi:MAG: hypothetical protein AAFZ92_04245 [Pseudomonadota bacterium]